MITELPATRLTEYAPYFTAPQPELVVASVAAGNTAARLWLADDDDPLALLWDKGNNVFYIAGTAVSATARSELANLIDTELRARAIAEGRAYFKVRALTPAVEAALPSLFDGIPLVEHTKFFLRFEQRRPNALPAPSVARIHFAPIDRALLERADLLNAEPVRQEIRWMWPSAERFHQHGFGYAALAGETVICWCTAEYVSAARCGIGIETVQAYQGKGVASATAALFVDEALRRGVQPAWECLSTNEGSRRVAEKVGFTPVDKVRFWTARFEG